MDDASLTRSLEQLGLDRQNWRAVSLLPLIEVAWADGRIQPAERKLLVAAAARHGIQPGSPFLARWLSKRPSKAAFLKARILLVHLWRRAHEENLPPLTTLEELLDLCVEVAESAGGVFGVLFPIEPAERDVITQIAQSLQLGPDLPERVSRSWSTLPPAGEDDDGDKTEIRLPRSRSGALTLPPLPVPDEEPAYVVAAPSRLARRPLPDLAPTGSFEDEVTVPYVDVDEHLDGEEHLHLDDE